MKNLFKKIWQQPILVTPLTVLVIFIATKYIYFPQFGRNVGYLTQIIVTLIIWALYIHYYGKKLQLRNITRRPLNTILIMLPLLIFEIVVIISACSVGVAWNKTSFIFSLCLGLESGIVEEIQFRGIAISHAMSIKNTKKQAVSYLLYSAFVFGIFHFINLFFGGTFLSTLGQVIMAIGFGLYLGAIYLRTGSIIPGVILHGLFDFAGAYRPADEEIRKAVSTGATSLSAVLTEGFIYIIILGGMALFLLRKSKWEQILENFKVE